MAYLDGELPVEQATAAAAHLEECGECQILVAEMKSVSEGLTAWEIESAEPALNAELSKALDERQEEPSAPRGGWDWLGQYRFRRMAPWAGGALAGGLAVLLLTFILISSFSHREYGPAPVATRNETMALSAAREVRKPGSDLDHILSDSAPLLSESQREEPLKRKEMAQLASNLENNHVPTVEGQRAAELATAPMIIHTAQLTVVIQNLDIARAQVDKIVERYSGYVGDLTVSAPSNGARTLTATLRVPATQLDSALAELKKLGRVESETQNGQDVSAQYVDLEARLSNSRNTEKRLLELLSNRTGKLSDVLEVETELSRVREEIERMEGERRLLAKQVEYATLTATVTEEYKAPASALPDSTATRFRNAAVDGYRSVVNFIIGVALFLISDGPMLVVWTLILLLPARWAWRRYRKYRETPSL
ncbi:MAG TPA: DUF4349 domain-containing protein [Terriglobales bacterium]